MLRFFAEAGILIFPIVLLALVIALLTLWNLVLLTTRPGHLPQRRRHSINSILFWGGGAAVLGFLGQWIGIHKMTVAVVEHGLVSPVAVAHGISESLLTPVAGMAVLVVAGALWSVLRLGLWSIESRP